MVDLVHIEPPDFVVRDLVLRAYRTGRTDERGEIFLRIDNEGGSQHLSPAEARDLAIKLIVMADLAERFSTRGFIGSKE